MEGIKDWLPLMNVAFPILFYWNYKTHNRVDQLEKDMLVNTTNDNEIKNEIEMLIGKVDSISEKINVIALDLEYQKGKNAKR